MKRTHSGIMGLFAALMLALGGLAALPDTAEALIIYDFDGPGAVGAPPSYTETKGGVTMTVTSVTLGPTSLPHLHFNSEIVGLDLVNHYDCCSTPYLFTFSTAVDLLGFDVVQNSITGLNTWTSSGGGLFSVSAGTGFFDVTTSGGPGWSGITSFTWDLPGSGTGLLGIDNLHIEVTEPMTVGLLGLGLLGLGFARRRLH